MRHLSIGVVLATVFVGGIDVKVEPIVYESEQKEETLLVKEWNRETIKEEIRKTFPEQPEVMIRIAECESSLNPKAHNTTLNRNGSTDGGLFQLNSVHKLDGDVFDPEYNIQFARKLYDERGTQPWNGSRHCWQKSA